MYCPKCEQQMSGDICPSCGYRSAFKRLGDMSAVPDPPEKTSAVFTSTVPLKTKPNIVGFKPMDELAPPEQKHIEEELPDVFVSTVSLKNKPATAGFKPMDEITPPKQKHVDRKFVEEPKKRDPARIFVWKQWMTIAACISAFLIFAIVISVTSQKGSTNSELNVAIDSYIQDEICVGEALPLMMQYQNAILGAITYDIQSYDRVSGTMDVEFTYVDVLHLADSITDPNISEDEYYSVCIAKIQSNECKMTTEVIQVALEPSEEGYSIIRSEQLVNVLSGGMLNYYVDLLEGTDYE